MKKYDSVVIGFGKGGKTIAGYLAKKGEKVAIIEESEQMYGGTCINVGCIPSKSLVVSSEYSYLTEGDYNEKNNLFEKAINKKRELVSNLRAKNYQKLASLVDIIDGKGSFEDEHTLKVESKDKSFLIKADKIFINTGSSSFTPDIPGLKESKFCHTSNKVLNLDKMPERLVIIGAGYIALEFASMYSNFGSKVTMLNAQTKFLDREDQEVAALIYESLKKKGIEILENTQVLKAIDKENHTTLEINHDNKREVLEADFVLIATGRRANVKDLNLDKAGVELNNRGAIITDKNLRTSKSHIYALGDVRGEYLFTYISLDDYRIVKSTLEGDFKRDTTNRGHIAYSVFIDPAFSRVGLSEESAREQYKNIKVAKMLNKFSPKANVLSKVDGIWKVIIDGDTDLIVGAHIFAPLSYEVINLIKLAMDQKIPYTVLRDNIYTHPTMSEVLNDLLSTI